MIQFLHLIALRQEHGELVVVPLARWQVLEEHERVLEAHLHQVFGEVQEESSTDVAMELREAFVLREVCVPDAYCLVDVKFSGEVATDPTIGKGYEVYLKVLQVLQDVWVSLLNQCLHFVDDFVHAWLQICVVVLYVVYQLGQAPEGVGLSVEHVFSKLLIDLYEFLGVNIADLLVELVEVFVLLGLLDLCACCLQTCEVFLLEIVHAATIVLFQNSVSDLGVEGLPLRLLSQLLLVVLPLLADGCGGACSRRRHRLKLLHVNPAIDLLLLAHSRQIRALDLLLIGIYLIMGCNVQLREVVLLLVGLEDELAHEDQQKWST